MAKFSKTSLDRLATVHPDLQTLFHKVIESWDCTIVSGFRTDEEQQELYARGRTEDGDIVTYKDGIVKKSKHQSGLAVDAVPYPSLYTNEAIMRDFGEYVLDVAVDLKKAGLIDSYITWGGHWRKFKDYPHFEIYE
jgi:signal peptidase I